MNVYVECPVFPQKWGLNEKKISFRFSLGNSTRLDSTRLDSTRLDSTSVLGKSHFYDGETRIGHGLNILQE